MIKFKHLLALSMTAALAANASAEEALGSEITFTGTVTTPTCAVKVSTANLEMGSISSQSFTKDIGKAKVSTAEAKTFTLNVVDESNNVCKSVSYGASNESDETSTQPKIHITALTGEITEDGYLANTLEENKTLGLLLTDSKGNKIDLNQSQVLADMDEGEISLKAYYVALSEKVEVQQFSASLNFTVDYK